MERRLAAILAVDVVGYSRLMGADESGTLGRLKAHRSDLVDLAIAGHRGRIFKTTGDGLFAEFASVVDALCCAVAIQDGMRARNADIPDTDRLEFRLGINVGDIMVDGDDILGDGVNVAARIESLARPGGICVSDRVREYARGKIDIEFDDAGEQRLKNIDLPVRVYHVRSDRKIERNWPALTLPDRPSIAVLPFTNMSGDAEQEYFADGMVEEIITALSRMSWLFVIARNSSFTYKGRAVDVKQVGRELGVRYVLEGSVRKAGNKVRITGQLIDATTGNHLWADRFDGALEDIFELQDNVTGSVVAAISPKLEQAEMERAKNKPTESLDAYDNYLRGVSAVHRWTREANDEALSYFHRAIELDPEFASAFGMVARCYSQRKICGWMVDRAHEIAEAEQTARRAADLGKDDAVALCTAGMALAYVVCNLDHGRTLIDRALQLNPNFAWAWLFSGWVRIWLGEPETAVEHVAQAMRLSPHDPQIVAMEACTAYGHFFAGRYDEASRWAEMSLQERPDLALPLGVLVASRAVTGRQQEAEDALAQLRKLEPDLRLDNLKIWLPLRRPDDVARLVDAFRVAGLPESGK
jgi:TolB-like protein/Flp pilus assembly protein TadD